MNWKNWKKEDGQAVVEFALVLPLLILLIFGMLDFGWLFYNKIEINNASREGARYAAVRWKEADYEDAAKQLVLDRAPNATVTIQHVGQDIVVSVSKEVDVLTGIGATFAGDTVELSASCTMRRE